MKSDEDINGILITHEHSDHIKGLTQLCKNNPNIKTEGDKQSVIRKQLSIAKTFHKLADAIAIDNNTSEREATKEIKNDNQKSRIDDIEPGSDENGPLF